MPILNLAKAMEQETGSQNDHIELNCFRKLCQQSRNGCYGKHTDKQICRRLSGKTLLWRMPVCRYRGRSWQETEQRNCLVVLMQMFSHIPVPRQIWLYSLHLVKPGETVMGMNLDHGGHLSHGSPANISGTYYHIVPYGVNDDRIY